MLRTEGFRPKKLRKSLSCKLLWTVPLTIPNISFNLFKYNALQGLELI